MPSTTPGTTLRRTRLSRRRRLVVALIAVCGLVLAAPSASPAQVAPEIRSLGGGGWCWFQDPRAIHFEGRHNRTYVGWVDREGDVKVASYDHTSRLRVTAVLHPMLGADDHNSPALYMRPDGRLMAFYSRHGGQAMYYRIAKRPESVTSWGAERALPTNTPGRSGYTYPNPLSLSAQKDRLWLFWRGGNWQPSFSTSADGGGRWSTARTLVSHRGHRPYVKFAGDGDDTIHLAFTQGHPASLNSNIYYAYYRNGSLYKADGTRIERESDLPLSPDQADRVYDTAKPAWVHDVAYDRRGRPVIVFTTIVSASEHRYHYARWDGRRWRRHRMVSAGGSIAGGREMNYSGGITLDHEHPSVAYLSRKTDGQFEVETWRTRDGGASWTSKPVTAGSGAANVRPISPRGLRSFDDDMSVLWMRGVYEYFTDYRTDLATRLLNGGNLPPIADAQAAPSRSPAPFTVRFDGTGSHDPDGSISRWSWHFGDGERAEGPTPSHTYRTPGRYFARLAVTDEAGDRDIFVREVVAE